MKTQNERALSGYPGSPEVPDLDSCSCHCHDSDISIIPEDPPGDDMPECCDDQLIALSIKGFFFQCDCLTCINCEAFFQCRPCAKANS